jgi:hypothetical protein
MIHDDTLDISFQHIVQHFSIEREKVFFCGGPVGILLRIRYRLLDSALKRFLGMNFV